jgi:serine/threonine-protein kinase
VLAERALAESNVGHEDVTRTYSFNQEQADPPSQVTSPGKRQQLSELKQEPLVIIQTDRSSRTPNKFAIALLVAAACAVGTGWVYRGAVGRYAQSWHASFLRGISAVTGSNKPAQRAPAPRPAVIGLSISVTPPDALLVIDGLRVANPYVAQRHPDKLIHNLIVEAPGYVSLQRQVQFDRDLTVVLALAPIPQPTQADVVAEPPQPPTVTPTGQRGRAHKATTKAAAPTSAGVQSNCSPPYVIDASGIKSYKPECL